MQITIDLDERSYPVLIGEKLLENAKTHLGAYIGGSQICIVSNDVVAPLYLSQLKTQLETDYQVYTHILPDGEVGKNLQVLEGIFETLLENACSRDVTLIALGGGVVGDMTGFAAASFMRGVDFIQIPTTLLAQVDSSVGGKTGVNHRLGKNMIGAFYQPKCVLADVGVLETLPAREYSAGLAEVIKYGLILDADFLSWLENNMQALLTHDSAALAYAVKRSCEIKAYVVSKDEKEKGLRALLNLGHTFGHAIEAHYQYSSYLHGEAVSIGMLMALELSALMGMIDDKAVSSSKKLLIDAKLPIACKDYIDPEILLSFMSVDKKALSGRIRLVLLEKLGKAVVTDKFDIEQLKQAMKLCMLEKQGV